MIHKHDSLAGGVARQAGRQVDHTAGKLHFCVWLLLLVQKGVAQHLHSAYNQFTDPVFCSEAHGVFRLLTATELHLQPLAHPC